MGRGVQGQGPQPVARQVGTEECARKGRAGPPWGEEQASKSCCATVLLSDIGLILSPLGLMKRVSVKRVATCRPAGQGR